MKKFAIVLLTIAIAASAAVAKEKPQPLPTLDVRGALDCSIAIPIGLNESVSGNNVGLPNNVNAYSCVGWNEAGGEAIYELVLDAEYVVTASIIGMAADLDIFFLDGCEEAACLAYGNNLFSTTVPAGTYYIVIDGYNGAEDFFALTVESTLVPPPAQNLDGGDTCAEAVDLQAAGMSYFSVDLANYTDMYDGGGCFSWHLPGGDAVYKIDLAAGENFRVTMDGACDMAMYLFADCASGEALACSDNCCTGAQEIIDYTAPYADTYYLVLDTFLSTGCEVTVTLEMPVANEDATWGEMKTLYR